MLRALLPLFALVLTLPAGAAPWQADYVMSVAGLPVMEGRARIDLGESGYQVETHVRSRGMGVVVSRGEQVTRVEGDWQGAARALPRSYETEGRWRRGPQRIHLAFGPHGAELRVQEPESDIPRTPIPADAVRGTVDNLSALALLARRVDRTGRCELGLRLYDGRRLVEASAQTRGLEPDGLRCEIELRQIAGFPLNRDPEEMRRPLLVQAWFARPVAGAPAVPVRVELASRWWGRVEMRLVRLDPMPS